jgi:hypothetical protein
MWVSTCGLDVKVIPTIEHSRGVMLLGQHTNLAQV